MNTTKIELHRMNRGSGREVWMMRWYGTDGQRYGETIGDTRKVTKRDAMTRLREKQSAMDGGSVRRDRPGRMTLAAFIDFYRDAAQATIRPRTLLEYGYAFDHAKAALGAQIVLDEVTVAHVGKVKSHLVKLGRSRTTIHKTLSQLRAVWTVAVKHNYASSNPFADHGVKPGDPKPARIFERPEIDKLLRAAPSQWWRAFLHLAFASGLRRDELLHLRWNDIDFNEGTITVQARKATTFTVNGENYPVLAWSAKANASYRTVPLPPDVLDTLRTLRDASDGSAYVFIALDRLQAIQGRVVAGKWKANHVLMNNLIRDWRVIQRSALGGDADLGTIHDMRKTYLTLTAAVVPMHVLKDLAGHSSITTTAKYYTRVRASDAEAVRKLWTAEQPALRIAG